jgi:ubiquinone/menaquinone biosynthesis C-methylase UbiE
MARWQDAGRSRRVGWAELADWWDRKQGETGDLWHRALIDPCLLEVVGDCRNKDVLDLGCGNGYLARRLARAGARVIAVDSSVRMIKNAKARDQGGLGIRYIRSAATSLRLADAKFDVVYANMSLDDIADAEGAIKEVSRVLKAGGRFVASISHPCFDNGSNSGWVMEKSAGEPPTVFRRIRGYRRSFPERCLWKVEDRSAEYTRWYHRPLSWYARAFRSSGLAITKLEEPMPTSEFLEEEAKKPGDLDAPGFLEVPLHLVFEAVKLGPLAKARTPPATAFRPLGGRASSPPASSASARAVRKCGFEARQIRC